MTLNSLRTPLALALLIAALLVLMGIGAANARSKGGHGGHGGHTETAAPGPAAPGPSVSSGPSTGTEADTRAGIPVGVTMNPGFCSRNPSDYFVRADRVICVGY